MHSTRLRYRIIDYNLGGEYFREDYATIVLKKILTPFPVGYVDLNSQPAVLPIIAFNYDGAVYASDESRMLAEMKDETFRLGHLDTHSYEEVFYGEKARAIVTASVNENLPAAPTVPTRPIAEQTPSTITRRKAIWWGTGHKYLLPKKHGDHSLSDRIDGQGQQNQTNFRNLG